MITVTDDRALARPVPLMDLQQMSKAIAESKMFGVANEAQAMTLMLLCQAEGLHPVMALRRYHIIDGKPAFRADALQGEFERDGAILWHERNEKECAATFFRYKNALKQGVQRAKKRYTMLKAGQDASDLAWPDEITIIRTFADAVEKKVACRWDQQAQQWVLKHNWQQSPRQMLHARCLTEGVRAVNPGLVAGVYTEDEILDIPKDQDNGDQRTPVAVIERNVRQATANAEVERPQVGDYDVATGGRIVSVQPPITKVTQDNYKELVVHIGKAEGEMLGRKVGELHPNIVEWLYTKWRDKLSPLSSEDDLRLKTAVEFAYQELQTVAAKGGGAEGESLGATASPARSFDEYSKDELIAELRERIGDLVITEEQACGYLRKEGVFTNEQCFADASGNLLRLLLRTDMWKAMTDIVEADLKPPKVEGGPPAKRKRTRQ